MNVRWIAIAAIVVIAAGGAIFAIRTHKPKPAPVVSPPAPAPAEITLTGPVLPRTIITATAPIAGTIDALFLDVNQPVYKDQLLGKIRNAGAELAAENAQADLDKDQSRITSLQSDQLAAKLEISRAEADQSRARADVDRLEKLYQRQKSLWELGATARLTFEKSEKDYNDAKAEVERQQSAVQDAHAHADRIAADLDAANRAVADATAALDRAKTALNAGEIHSPADGIVVARHGQPGETVEQNAAVFEIGTDLTLLTVPVPANPRIHAGQSASIHVPELVPDEIPGTVREIRGDQAIIDFTSPVAASKLDLTAQVRIKF